jgi:hypothetical protein
MKKIFISIAVTGIFPFFYKDGHKGKKTDGLPALLQPVPVTI